MTNPNRSKELLEEATHQGLIYPEDAERALEFVHYYSTNEKLSIGSKKKYYYCLKAFLLELHRQKTTIAGLTEKTVLDLKAFVHESAWSEDTRADYWDRLTRFWSWAADRAADDGDAWDVRAYRLMADPKHKKAYKIDKNRVEKKGILSPEEILLLVDAESNLCYKAFFSVLYESGMRSGEAFSLLRRDVEAHPNGCYTLHIRRSKTQKRPVPLMGSACNYLRKWLSQSSSSDLDEPLWVNSRGTVLNGFTANKELKLLLRVTQINRAKVSLHSFRHSRATELAGKGLTEFEMCRLFGWRVGSKMPATYIREGALDVRTALRRASGLPVESESVKPVGVRCVQCDHVNADGVDYCDNCRLPLAVEQLQAVKDNARLLSELELGKQYARDLFREELRAVAEEFGLILKS